MKDTNTVNIKTATASWFVSVVAVIVPGPAWSHPGHGLDGLWVHDVLHGATVVLAIALVTLLTVGFIRQRRQKKRD